MREMRKRLRFISVRVQVTAFLCLGAFLLLLILEVLSAGKSWDFTVVILFTLGLGAVLTAVYIFWIYRPFQKEEMVQKQFLDGYMALGRFHQMGEGSVLTPESGREREKIGEILMSGKLFILNKRQAQYLALQNQINPHFLYNTLDGIRSEALIAGVDHVAEMTEALATYFRYTISKVENLVTVEEELNNCEIYFKIQQYRFGERIRLVIDCQEENEGEIRQCLIPKLTLQPILENSIIHGTELKLGKGTQTIHFMLTGNRLLIRVSDDGVGIDVKTLAKINDRLGRSDGQSNDETQEQRGGIALYNVNHRIHLIFGEEYGLHVFSMENVGTDVEISIPAVYDESEIKN